MIILDTDILSALRRPERRPDLRAWLATQAEAELFLSAITIGEIARGIEQQRARDPDFARDLEMWLNTTIARFGDRILPFGAAEAWIWGGLSARIGHQGADLQIAATALVHDAAIATGNTRHFAPTHVRLVTPSLS